MSGFFAQRFRSLAMRRRLGLVVWTRPFGCSARGDVAELPRNQWLRDTSQRLREEHCLSVNRASPIQTFTVGTGFSPVQPSPFKSIYSS